MARYEPRRCPRLETNRVYDTKEERFTTSDEVSDLLNAYDGMMTRIKSLIKTAKSISGFEHDYKICTKCGLAQT